MQILETPYHKIFTDQVKPPQWACLGPCRRVWWDEDLGKAEGPAYLKCCGCGGKITKATEEHYTLIFWDRKGPNPKKMSIGYVSNVKPGFEEKAKKEWFPQGQRNG